MMNFIRSLICGNTQNNGLREENESLKASIMEYERRIKELRGSCQEHIRINEEYAVKIREYEEILGAHFFKFGDKRQITRSQCRTAFKPYTLTDTMQAFADNTYYTVSKEEMEQFLELDKTNLRKHYVTEFFDCDDFAFRLKGNITTQNNAELAFFIIWSGLHAFNAFIDHNHKVWFIEPQSDIIMDADDVVHEYYKNLKIIIG